VIGGENGDGKLKAVELYNWQLSEICDLPELPFGVSGMVGTIINGSQVFCGGETNVLLTKCYKLLLSNMTWIEVSYILRAPLRFRDCSFDQKYWRINLLLCSICSCF